MKQRREKELQNAKDRKLGKENFLTALKAGCKADRALNDTQNGAHSNDESINGSNADTTTPVDNIDNIEIAQKMQLMLQQMQKTWILIQQMQII